MYRFTSRKRLSGEVAIELAEADSCTAGFDSAVYVFGEDVTPNRTDTPVATGLVTFDTTTSVYGYLIDDLLADTYSAAFTCTGTDFVPIEGKEPVITIGEDTPLDFVAADAPAP